MQSYQLAIVKFFSELYTAKLIILDVVIPAKAGIQKNTGFRVKPGMTNSVKLMSSCIIPPIAHFAMLIFYFVLITYRALLFDGGVSIGSQGHRGYLRPPHPLFESFPQQFLPC